MFGVAFWNDYVFISSYLFIVIGDFQIAVIQEVIISSSIVAELHILLVLF